MFKQKHQVYYVPETLGLEKCCQGQTLCVFMSLLSVILWTRPHVIVFRKNSMA